MPKSGKWTLCGWDPSGLCKNKSILCQWWNDKMVRVLFILKKTESNDWWSKFKIVRSSEWSNSRVSFRTSLVRDIHKLKQTGLKFILSLWKNRPKRLALRPQVFFKTKHSLRRRLRQSLCQVPKLKKWMKQKQILYFQFIYFKKI